MCNQNGFSSKGFTFLEFLVALAMLAATTWLAVPSLQQSLASNQLISANHSIVTGLNLARSTAITTGDDITICPSRDGATCAEDNWDNGWIVFNDANADGNAVADEIIRVVAIEGEVANSGFGENIVFQADGTTSLDASATINNCREQGASGENCANVEVNQFGLVESEKYQTTSEESGSTPPVDEPTS